MPDETDCVRQLRPGDDLSDVFGVPRAPGEPAGATSKPAGLRERTVSSAPETPVTSAAAAPHQRGEADDARALGIASPVASAAQHAPPARPREALPVARTSVPAASVRAARPLGGLRVAAWTVVLGAAAIIVASLPLPVMHAGLGIVFAVLAVIVAVIALIRGPRSTGAGWLVGVGLALAGIGVALGILLITPYIGIFADAPGVGPGILQ